MDYKTARLAPPETTKVQPETLPRALPELKAEVEKECQRRQYVTDLAGKTFQFATGERVFKVDGSLIPYLGMTLMHMVSDFGTSANIPVDMPAALFEFCITTAKAQHTLLSALPRWPSKAEQKNIAKETMHELQQRYELTLETCLTQLETLRAQFFERYMATLRTEVGNMSVEAFSDAYVALEKYALTAQLRSLADKIKDEITKELLAQLKKEKPQLTRKDALQAINPQVEKQFTVRFAACRKQLYETFANVTTPNICQQVRDAAARKAMLVTYLRKRWVKLFVDLTEQAGNYYDNSLLFFMFGLKLARILLDKTPEEIREALFIVNDFDDEEYEEIKKENRWFEKV